MCVCGARVRVRCVGVLSDNDSLLFRFGAVAVSGVAWARDVVAVPLPLLVACCHAPPPHDIGQRHALLRVRRVPSRPLPPTPFCLPCFAILHSLCVVLCAARSSSFLSFFCCLLLLSCATRMVMHRSIVCAQRLGLGCTHHISAAGPSVSLWDAARVLCLDGHAAALLTQRLQRLDAAASASASASSAAAAVAASAVGAGAGAGARVAPAAAVLLDDDSDAFVRPPRWLAARTVLSDLLRSAEAVGVPRLRALDAEAAAVLWRLVRRLTSAAGDALALTRTAAAPSGPSSCTEAYVYAAQETELLAAFFAGKQAILQEAARYVFVPNAHPHLHAEGKGADLGVLVAESPMAVDVNARE